MRHIVSLLTVMLGATSLVAHGLLLTCGALLISHSLRSRPSAPAPQITPQGEVEVEFRHAPVSKWPYRLRQPPRSRQ